MNVKEAWERLQKIYGMVERNLNKAMDNNINSRNLKIAEEFLARLSNAKNEAAKIYEPHQAKYDSLWKDAKQHHAQQRDAANSQLDKDYQNILQHNTKNNAFEIYENVNRLQASKIAVKQHYEDNISMARTAISQEVFGVEEPRLREHEAPALLLLDDVSRFANDLNNKLTETATAKFRDNSELFKQANQEHRNSAAKVMFLLIVVIISAIILLVYFSFFFRFSLFDKQDCSLKDPLIFATILSTTGGKIALILLVYWSIKFLSALYKTHIKQSVVYYDRDTALGIAEVLLNFTPNIEQKQELIKRLADGYLDFRQSAFFDKADAQADGPTSPLTEAKEAVKELVEVVRPVQDLLKDAVKPSK